MSLFFSLLILSAPPAVHADDFASGYSSRAEAARDPSALVIPPRKRAYPGGADEEDLSVQPELPEAEVKVDSRTLQRGVYKTVYSQELKEERHDDAEE